MNAERLQFAFRAFGWHLLGSAAVAALVSWLVFGLWYPGPYAAMVGGLELFVILMAVDVVCGPLLTFVLFNPTKSRKELTLDLGLVAVLQLLALGYGLHTMGQARPVYLAFEVDRFYAITYANIGSDEWATTPPNVPSPGWTGPQMLATRVAQPSDADYLAQVQISMTGVATVYRPDRWMPYESAAVQLRERAKPLSALYSLNPDSRVAIDKEVGNTGVPVEQLRWLPVQVKKSGDWVALIDFESLKVLGFLPLGGF